MDFDLSDDQRLIQETARKLVAGRVQPILDAHDRSRPLPKTAVLALLQLLAAEGLTAPRVPSDHGGSGMKMLDYGIFYEQLPPMVAQMLVAHEVTVTRIQLGSRESLWRSVLPELIAGRQIACSATTEPDVGSDSGGVTTRVREEGDHLVVTGRKMWITNGDVSDIALVTCAGADTDGRRTLRRILVQRAASPYESRDIDRIGVRQGHLSELVFEDCRVPKENVVGEGNDAPRILTTTWNVSRPLLGLTAVGLAQRAFDAARSYAGMRQQFGRKLGATQLVQRNLVDIAAAIETSRLFCYKALAEVDSGRRANAISAMAKRYATNACLGAVSLAMEIHGAMGLSAELGLEALYRDARMLLVPDGTNEILTLIAGREITGTPAFRV